MENKYRAFKLDMDEELETGSFFVIRRKDVLGAQTLYAYAHLLQSAVELDTLHGFLSPEERARLGESADDVASLADDWMRSNSKKLPD